MNGLTICPAVCDHGHKALQPNAPKPNLPPTTKPQTNENDKFSLEHGFGDNEFNFTKMLDDVPEGQQR